MEEEGDHLVVTCLEDVVDELLEVLDKLPQEDLEDSWYLHLPPTQENVVW